MAANPIFDEALFPRYGTRGEKLAFLLRYAALAYSPFNTQPWHFAIKHDTVEIHIDPSRQLTVRDPESHQMLLSCGAVVGNLIIACRYFGYEPNFNLLTGKLNSTLVGTVALGALVEPSIEHINWFEKMTQMETGFVPFRRGPNPATLMPVVARVAKNYRTRVKNIDGQQKALLKITATAIESEQANKSYYDEFCHWVRSSNQSAEDGLTASYFGVGPMSALLGKKWVARLTAGSALIKGYKQLFSGSAGGFIINTESDNPDVILEAGIVLQQSLLAIRANGLLPIICQPTLELTQVRQDLGKRFCDGRLPQAMVLYGWVKKQGVILPKRPIEDLIVATGNAE